MAKKSWHNPIAFTPSSVTTIITVVYIALIAVLLTIHVTVPSAPSSSPYAGVNLSEAWLDLKTLSNGYHPYNSHRNDEIRNWLLLRLEDILRENRQAFYKTENSGIAENDSHKNRKNSSTPVVIFNDLSSNVSFSEGSGPGVYFEGTNIIVYIRGTEDDKSNWWLNKSPPQGLGGVLVNAHYDSVSTGYGATDDGMGVITVLQLIKHFTTPGHAPKKGIVALLNNGEEDFLNGARAFVAHPTSKFVRTFLNLEGAGAGGRATLFRSTDTEVTRFYAGTRHPFGTVVSGDAFKRRVIASETDYVVFNGILGLRGLDVAFMEPRARYHTNEDDVKHTSIDSLWHMMSTAVVTMRGLTDDLSNTFGEGQIEKGENPAGTGSDGVWFDLFGTLFAVSELHSMFAISVTLLVVAPITLITVLALLSKQDKLYLFAIKKKLELDEDEIENYLGGLRGLFRFPIIFAIATVAVIGLAFLVNTVNPYIAYSSPWALWSMMLSAWLFVAWFQSKFADFVRPSALHRVYALGWMFGGSWVLLVAVTVLEDRYQIAGGYPVIFMNGAIFIATLIALLELFGLPTKVEYVDDAEASEGTERRAPIDRSRDTGLDDDEEQDAGIVDTGVATESTSLLSGNRRKNGKTTFKRYLTSHHVHNHEVSEADKEGNYYSDEQPWSETLPTWTWTLQFVVIAFISIVFVGQVALLFTSATYQTLADGKSPLLLYIAIAIFSSLLLAPTGPFLHRYSYHVPTFLLAIFIATLVYNLLAFPFSPANRLKIRFLQYVDLDRGFNEVSLAGLTPYMSLIASGIPSTSGHYFTLTPSTYNKNLQTISWRGGLPPNVIPANSSYIPPESTYAEWLSFTATRHNSNASMPNAATFTISGRNTRNCKIQFSNPISSFSVRDAGPGDPHYRPTVGHEGVKEIRLWSRTWEKPWVVDVEWNAVDDGHEKDDREGRDGKVVCLWNNEGKGGVVPAFDEVRRFVPAWVGVTKMGDGLVEGGKAFLV